MNGLRLGKLALPVLLALALHATGCAAPAARAPTPEATVSSGAGVAAGDATGAWKGEIDVAGQKIDTVVRLKDEGAVVSGNVDFPGQSALGLKLEKVTRNGNTLHFEVLPAPRTAVFDGEIKGDVLAGGFQQAGYKGTFILRRQQEAQMQPTRPTGYSEEEVTFKNGDITLAGTLSLPHGSGPHPAVVLISGSGAQNRDEELFGFRLFGVVADHLATNGIAVLRYDDRGIGGSSTGTQDDTSETYAGDVKAALDFLKARKDIDPKHVGLLGHSEGGIIAPLVAASSDDVAFVIMMAGPGIPGREILVDQVGLVARAGGASAANVAKAIDQQRRAIDAVLTGEGMDGIKAELRAEAQAAASLMTEDQRKALGNVEEWLTQVVDMQLEVLASPWMKFFLVHDPAPVLEEVRVPVLALFGGKDSQVEAERNRDAVAAALERGGSTDHTEKIFPDANHLFQAATTGSPNEYATLKPEFVPGFLDTISDWILQRVKIPAP